MIATILAAAAFATPLGTGTVDRPLVKTIHYGQRLEVVLPPRTEVSSLSDCHWLRDVHVTGYRERWNADRTVQLFGPVTFDGLTIINQSKTRTVRVDARLFDGCR